MAQRAGSLQPPLLRRAIGALLTLAALLLAGDRAAGAAPPPSTADTLAGLEGRLHRYRDHLERSSRKLNLAEALATGLSQNPILARAYAQIDATDWAGVAIRREWNPSLSMDNNSPGLVGVQQQQADTLSLSSPQLTLEWTFFDPSRTPRARANASLLAADRFLFDVEARSLVLTIQQQYFDLQSLLELEKEYRRLSEIVGNWRGMARARGHQGASSPDLDQLTSEELALLILRIDTHEQVIVAASRLAQSLSLPPGDLVMPGERLELRGQWTLSRRETIAQALELREEIQRSLANAKSQAWSAVATRKGYLPTLSLEGTGSTVGNSINSGLQSEGDVGLNVQWTLFDGGILGATATSQRRQQEQSLQQAALDRLQVTAEVETTYAGYLSSQIVVDAARAQVQSALAGISAATLGFRAGTSDATTLLQVLGNGRAAVEAYVRALQKHNRSVAALYRYSARWPEGAPPLLQQRLAALRANPIAGQTRQVPTPGAAGTGP